MADTGNWFSDIQQPASPSPATSNNWFQDVTPETGTTSQVMSGPISDYFFSNTTPGKIISAFGQGYKDNWGGAHRAEQETEKALGLSPEDSKIHYDLLGNLTKSFNDTITRPGISALFNALSVPTGVISGTQAALIEGATQLREKGQSDAALANQMVPGASQIESLLGGTEAEIGEMGQAVLSGQLPIFPGMQTGEPVKPFTKIEPTLALEQDLLKSRAIGKLGEGEEGYYNTRSPSEEDVSARQDAAQETGELPPTIDPPETDPEKVARQIWPELFQNWDKLKEEQELNRANMVYLKTKRGSETEKKIFTLLAQVEGDETRLNETQVGRLNNLRDIHDQEINKYSPEMFKVQKRIQDLDYRMRDFGPLIADSVDHAKTLIPYYDLPQVKSLLFKSPDEIVNEIRKTKEDLAYLESKKSPPVSQVSISPSSSEPPTGPQKATQPLPEGVVPTVDQTGSGSLLKPLEGTGEVRIRGAARSILGDDENLPEYRSVVNEYMINKANEIIKGDPRKAFRIAMGHETAPSDVAPETVLNELVKKARAEGNTELQRRLGTQSQVLSDLTTFGQRMQAMRGLDAQDPVKIIRNISESNKREAVRRGRDIIKETKQIVDQIKNNWKETPMTHKTWEDFIQSIECTE